MRSGPYQDRYTYPRNGLHALWRWVTHPALVVVAGSWGLVALGLWKGGWLS